MCAVTMSAAKSVAARFTVSCRLDVDGDGVIRTSTDLSMISRSILGMSGATVLVGVFNPTGSRATEALINDYVAPRLAETRYDVNIDRVTDWRDAAILFRALSGFTGNAVTIGLIPVGCKRQFWDQPTPNGAADGMKQYLTTSCAAGNF